jgi:hypothetical protein
MWRAIFGPDMTMNYPEPERECAEVEIIVSPERNEQRLFRETRLRGLDPKRRLEEPRGR